MPFSFVCPYCGLETQVADRYAGQTGPCARCGKTVTVPPLRDAIGARLKPGVGLALSLIALVLVGGVALLALFGHFLLQTPRAGRDTRQIQCANNLRRIGMALHEYHNAYRCFPPAVVADSQGNPMHSWRVAILPYLGEHSLYAQYDWKEPWNGPNNRNLAVAAPSVYRCPAEPSLVLGATSYVMIAGAGAVGGESGKPVSLADIRDGASNTILVVEVAGSQIGWTTPRDLRLDELSLFYPNGAGARGPSSNHAAGVNVLFCDGSVQALTPAIDPATLRLLLLHSDGMVIDTRPFAQPVP
jgi:prepilin-type processing-associated H-X9-DG protein